MVFLGFVKANDRFQIHINLPCAIVPECLYLIVCYLALLFTAVPYCRFILTFAWIEGCMLRSPLTVSAKNRNKLDEMTDVDGTVYEYLDRTQEQIDSQII